MPFLDTKSKRNYHRGAASSPHELIIVERFKVTCCLSATHTHATFSFRTPVHLLSFTFATVCGFAAVRIMREPEQVSKLAMLMSHPEATIRSM